jgi:hypothetical protein
MVGIYFSSVLTRYSLPTVLYQGPYFIAAFLIWFISMNAWNVFTFAYVTRYIHRLTPNSPMHRLCDRILQKWFFGRIEDWISVLGCMHAGLYLYARVLAGPCPEGATLCKPN